MKALLLSLILVATPAMAWADEKADYLALPGKLPASAKRAQPRSDAEVDALVASIGEQPLAASGLDDAAISRALGQGFGFLRGELAKKTPKLKILGSTPHEGYSEKTVALEDPYVGTISGILLLPDSKTPSPAILALHGHGDSAAVYRDEHHAALYAQHGIAVLMITSRVMKIDADEHEVAKTLLAWDQTLMGVRVYEALLALKALRATPGVDAERVGLIGHSGGSSTGNLVVRLDATLRAYVSDHSVDWASSGDEPYHCESVPGLFPLHRLVDDFSTCSAAVKSVEYGFGRVKPLGIDELEIGQLVSFFDKQLGSKPFAVPGGDGAKYPYTCTFHWFRLDDRSVVGLDVIRDDGKGALGLRVFQAKDLPAKGSAAPESALLSMIQIAPKDQWEPFATSRPSSPQKNWLARGTGFVAGHVKGSHDVAFDFSVSVQNEGTPSVQLGELGKPFTKLNAIDTLSALSEGTITIDGVTHTIHALGPASIHYGDSLPDYAYLATVPDPSDPDAGQLLLSATNFTNFGAKTGDGTGSIYAYVKTKDEGGRTFFVPLGVVKNGEIPLGVGKTLTLSDFTDVPHDLLGVKTETGTATATITERKLIDTTDVVSFFKAIFGHGPVSRVTTFKVIADLRGGYVPAAAPPSKTSGVNGSLR